MVWQELKHLDAAVKRLEDSLKTPRGTWCWPLLHVWSRWEDYATAEVAGRAPDTVRGVLLVQERCCLRCWMKQRRKVFG